MSQADLGEAAFGVRRNSAVQDLKKGSIPSIDRLEQIARVLGFECYFGPPRQPVVTHLQGQLREVAGGGSPVLAPPTGYVTFVWHRDCDPGNGIPPLAVSQAFATRHGLDADNHLTIAIGPRPDRPQDPHAFAVVDPEAPHEGGPAPWAFRATRDGPVEIAPVRFLDRRTFALPTPAMPDLRDITLYPATLLGRVLWSGSKPP